MPETTDEQLPRAEALVGRHFKRPELLRCALTHASAASTPEASNERLEFLGDSVLGLVVCDELFSKYPQLAEGDLTKMKSFVVSRESCAKVCRRLGLHQLLSVVGPRPGNLPVSVLAGLLEAAIGALYVDGGLQVARDFILRGFADELAQAGRSTHLNNWKAELQQHAQRSLHVTPEYRTASRSGPEHRTRFEVVVLVGGEVRGSGQGMTKKEAEQNAARAALVALGLSVEDAAPAAGPQQPPAVADRPADPA